MSVPGSSRRRSRAKSPELVEPEKYFSINESTFSHASRLAIKDIYRICQYLIEDGLTQSGLRTIAIDMALRIEKAMIEVVAKTKAAIFGGLDKIKIMPEEIAVLHKYISAICVIIVTAMFSILKHIQTILRGVSERLGQLPIFSGLLGYTKGKGSLMLMSGEEEAEFLDSEEEGGELTDSDSDIIEIPSPPGSQTYSLTAEEVIQDI